MKTVSGMSTFRKFPGLGAHQAPNDRRLLIHSISSLSSIWHLTHSFNHTHSFAMARGTGRGRGRGRGSRSGPGVRKITDTSHAVSHAPVYDISVSNSGVVNTKRKYLATINEERPTTSEDTSGPSTVQGTSSEAASGLDDVGQFFHDLGADGARTQKRPKRVRLWGHDNGVRPLPDPFQALPQWLDTNACMVLSRECAAGFRTGTHFCKSSSATRAWTRRPLEAPLLSATTVAQSSRLPLHVLHARPLPAPRHLPRSPYRRNLGSQIAWTRRRSTSQTIQTRLVSTTLVLQVASRQQRPAMAPPMITTSR